MQTLGELSEQDIKKKDQENKQENQSNPEDTRIKWSNLSNKEIESTTEKRDNRSKRVIKKFEQAMFAENSTKLRADLRNVYALTSPMQHNLKMQKLDSSFDIFKLESQFDEIEISKKGENFQAFVIGICGGANSGKSFIVEEMEKDMGKLGIGVVVLKEKNFFKKIDQVFETDEERINFISKYDFDSPDAIDWVLFEKALEALVNKKPFNSPIYDQYSEKRLLLTNKLSPKDLIIIEGRQFYYYENLRNKIDFKLFLHTDNDLILSRRVYKNLARGKPLDQVISKYQNYVKPAYEKYVEPCKRYADIVIPNFGGTTFDEKTQSKHTFPVLQMLNDLVELRIKNIHQYKRKVSECSVQGDLEEHFHIESAKLVKKKSRSISKHSDTIKAFDQNEERKGSCNNETRPQKKDSFGDI